MALPLPAFFKRKTDLTHHRGDANSLPILTSQRLSLCWIDYADFAGIYDIFSDANVTRYWSHPGFTHQDDAHIYIESIHHGFNDGKILPWGICLKGTQKLIGSCTLSDINPAQGRAEVSFAIVSSQWGHGYGHEAMNTLIQHSFQTLGLRRLEADVNPLNTSCLKSLEALGFKREGYFRQRWEVAGELQDSIVLGLLKSDWLQDNNNKALTSISASVSLL